MGVSNVVPKGMFAWTNWAAVITRAIPAPSLKLSGPHSGGKRYRDLSAFGFLGIQALSLAVRAVADGTGLGKDLAAMRSGRPPFGQRQRWCAPAVERLPDPFGGTDEVDVAEHCLHLGPIDRQRACRSCCAPYSR